MIEEKLKYWIAQSESWKTFLKFDLPVENKAKYKFLSRFKDFYISLFSNLIDYSNLEEFTDEHKKELLSIAKGLEIFSLYETRTEFQGINFEKNMLYVGTIYYITGYSTSSFLLANFFKESEFITDIQKFLYAFLSKKMNVESRYTWYLYQYLNSGNQYYINKLITFIKDEEQNSINNNPDEYILCKFALLILEDFKSNNIWSDINEHAKNDETGDKSWEEYVYSKLSQKPPVWSFFPSQKKALEQGVLIKDKTTFTLKMPTSAGKTALCELIIYNHIMNYPDTKVLFLAPFRSLATELKSDLSERLKMLNMFSKLAYGGNVATTEETEDIKNVDLLIATPEKFVAIEGQMPDIYKEFSLIICDEGHLLDDSQRGVNFELLLAKLKADNDIERRFIYLSAILPNVEEINKWLGGNEKTIVKSLYRPTGLEYAFLKEDSSGKNFSLDINPTLEYPYNYQLYNFLIKGDFQYVNPQTKRTNTYNPKSIKSRSVASATKALVTGSVAIFTPQKGRNGINGLAKEIIEQVDKLDLQKPLYYADIDKLDELKGYVATQFGNDYLLTKIIGYGAAFHHGDLPQDVREAIETAFRLNQFKLLICTNTIAEGVNLPIKTLVINSIKRYNSALETQDNLKLRDLKNLFGRAGRAGKESNGLIIVPNKNDFARIRKVINDEENEEASGPLSKTITKIANVVVKDRIVLTNELLEQSSEELLELIDVIDFSLISLITEEIYESELESKIISLIENTYAYQKMDKQGRNMMEDLFLLRGGRIRPYIGKSDFNLLKTSNTNIRFFEIIKNQLDLKDSIWRDTLDPLSELWIEHIMRLIWEIPKTDYTLNNFNQTNNTVITIDEIKSITKLWLSGKWYGEISNNLNLEIDLLLKIFASLINPIVYNYSAKIIKIAENLQDEENIVSETIIRWPQYVQYGLKSKTDLDLQKIGFVNREVVLIISSYIEQFFSYSNLRQLKKKIILNKEEILEQIRPKLSLYSYREAEERISYLEKS